MNFVTTTASHRMDFDDEYSTNRPVKRTKLSWQNDSRSSMNDDDDSDNDSTSLFINVNRGFAKGQSSNNSCVPSSVHQQQQYITDLVSHLVNHQQNEHIVVNDLGQIADCMSDNSICVSIFNTIHGQDKVLQIMSLWYWHAEIQAQGCRTLRNVWTLEKLLSSSSRQQHVSSPIQLSACEKILAILKNFPHHDWIQLYGTSALHTQGLAPEV